MQKPQVKQPWWRDKDERIFACAMTITLLIIATPFIWAFVPENPEVYRKGWEEENKRAPILVHDTSEMDAMVAKDLWMYKLPSGMPLVKPRVVIEPESECMANGHAFMVAFTDDFSHQIHICENTAKYPADHLERVLKHELIHVWIMQSGVHLQYDHGPEFMRKALEVGTDVLDEDENR